MNFSLWCPSQGSVHHTAAKIRDIPSPTPAWNGFPSSHAAQDLPGCSNHCHALVRAKMPPAHLLNQHTINFGTSWLGFHPPVTLAIRWPHNSSLLRCVELWASCTSSTPCIHVVVHMFPSLPKMLQVQPAPLQCPGLCWMQTSINRWDWQYFQCLGSLVKSKLSAAWIPFSTVPIVGDIHTYLLVTIYKITSIASILSYKQWPRVSSQGWSSKQKLFLQLHHSSDQVFSL